ncbi:MAG: hypothetical protein JNJ61_30725 [Anaerolineae bacterium]|nr:hypothetical protein [Anaerolineae bacterium]
MRRRRLYPHIHPFALASHTPKAARFNWRSSDVSIETINFINALLGRCNVDQETACLTLTAIHPNGCEHTPSRHLPLNQPDRLHEALQRLHAANQLGWGAYFAVGLRRQGLGRWQRGGKNDILALPAPFVDLDDHTPQALAKLRAFILPPSCIVDSGGGGFHAYWWLGEPTAELNRAGRILQTLTMQLQGDALSVAQSLRLPQTRNTKPHRGGLCHVIDLSYRHYTLTDFEALLPTVNRQSSRREKPYSSAQTLHTLHADSPALNPALIEAVATALYRDYGGYGKDNGYIAALCPYGHQHDAPGKHFNFDPAHGVGVCFGRHGRLLLRDLCALLHLDPAAFGGIYQPKERKLAQRCV